MTAAAEVLRLDRISKSFGSVHALKSASMTLREGEVVALLGDGAAGFSLIEADSLVRHGLPVVLIVGNNGMWGLEKHPMQAIYGWDMACDLQPGCRYDEVVTALGGGGELVTDPEQVGPALDRGFAAGVPYLINVVTDPRFGQHTGGSNVWPGRQFQFAVTYRF